MNNARALLSVIRTVGKLPHGHPARALLFKMAGQPFGISAHDARRVLSLAWGRK